MKTFGLIPLLLVAAASLVQAQNPAPAPAKEAPPDGAMLQTNAGDFAAWVVTITPAKPAKPAGGASSTAAHAPAAPAAPPQTIVITKTKPIFHLQTSNGPTLVEDRWIIRDVQVVVPPGSLPFVSHPYGGADISYAKSDFPELDWVTKDKFERVIRDETSSQKALVFKDTLTTTDIDGNVSGKEEVTAIIDFDTRLPISLQKPSSVRTYQFKAPPAGMLTIPPEVMATLALENRNQYIVRRQPGRP